MYDNNEALAIAFLRHMERNELNDALALASDDMEYWLAAPGKMNKAQCRNFFAPVGEMVSSMRFEITGSTVQGARVALEVKGAAELKNGRSYHNLYHFLFICEEGRIRVVREYTDSAPAVAAFFAP
jgi:ketosteroid isomerase-like protein